MSDVVVGDAVVVGPNGPALQRGMRGVVVTVRTTAMPGMSLVDLTPRDGLYGGPHWIETADLVPSAESMKTEGEGHADVSAATSRA